MLFMIPHQELGCRDCLAIQDVIEDIGVPCTLFVNNQLASLFAPYSKYSFKATLTFHCSLLMCCYHILGFYENLQQKWVFLTLFYSGKSQAL